MDTSAHTMQKPWALRHLGGTHGVKSLLIAACESQKEAVCTSKQNSGPGLYAPNTGLPLLGPYIPTYIRPLHVSAAQMCKQPLPISAYQLILTGQWQRTVRTTPGCWNTPSFYAVWANASMRINPKQYTFTLNAILWSRVYKKDDIKKRNGFCVVEKMSRLFSVCPCCAYYTFVDLAGKT